MISRFSVPGPGRSWGHPQSEDIEEEQVWGGPRGLLSFQCLWDIWWDGQGQESFRIRARGGMGKSRVAHGPHNQDGLVVGAEVD